jgi:hypothetical protein
MDLTLNTTPHRFVVQEMSYYARCYHFIPCHMVHA